MKLEAQQEEQTSEGGARRVFHELEVHQLELEMQNAELYRARNELEAALAQYTDLYDFAPVGYFTLTPEGVIRMVNLTGSRLAGIERSRLVGRSFVSLLATSRRPEFNTFLKQVFSGQVAQEGDFELAGSQPPRIVSIEAQRTLNGEECRAAVVDITERKVAELARNRLATIVESSDDAIIGKDMSGIITSWNRGASMIFGYSADEIVGSSILRLIPADRRGEELQILGQIKSGNSVRHFETQRVTKDGRLIDVSITASPIRDDSGRVAGVSKIARDVTARKLAEKVIQRNEALFSALVMQAPVGVYVVNSKFQIQQVNPNALPVFKKIYPLIGRDFSEVLRVLWPRRVADQVTKRFRHTLKTGEMYQAPEFTERRHDTGKTETYEWQIQRVTLPAGEHGVVCFFSDITERRKAEQTQQRLAVLAASNQKLEQEIVRRHSVEEALRESGKDQIRLTARTRDLAHQVLYAQEEERKRISRELHDKIAQTLVSVGVHLAALSRDATANAKGLPGKIARTQRLVTKSVEEVHRFARALRPTALDDLGLIPTLHAHLKEFTKQTGVRCHLTAFVGHEQLRVEERTVLYRVAQEAISNVARHARAGRLDVKLKKMPGAVCMSIHDDGRSFPAQRVLSPGGSERLGLVGMKERLEMVGGTFEIESAPGRGTTIIATIPSGTSGRTKKRFVRARRQ